MTKPDTKVFPLQAIRTDGWFERVAESIGSFELLCDILGEVFVAFSLITGARVTALTVDRRSPDDTLVDFEIGESEEETQSQRLRLADFRQRLVSALTTEEPSGPTPERETDTQGIQRHVGVRYLLLAPLFGYSLELLRCGPSRSEVVVNHDGAEVEFELEDFQQLLRSHVMQEFFRAGEAVAERRGGLELSLIPTAEQAASEGRHPQVVELLGGWMVPLTILLRTPDGQRLDRETRATLASALALLGSSLAALGQGQQGQAAFRLAVQYALDTPYAGNAYARMGAALMREKRYGEAIGALRRAANLGGDPEAVWPALAIAFLERGRLLAALGAAEAGTQLLGPEPKLQAVRAQVFSRLPALEGWERLLGER